MGAATAAAAASDAAATAMTEDEEEEDALDDMLAGIEQNEAAAMAGQDAATNTAASIQTVCEDELKRFMAAPPQKLRLKLPGAGGYLFNDPLKWWSENCGLYPILAGLARIYLALQATSAPSERVFSVASRLISNKRASLEPEIAGKLLYVSENWKWWENQLDLHTAVEKASEEQEVVNVD